MLVLKSLVWRLPVCVDITRIQAQKHLLTIWGLFVQVAHCLGV